MKLVYVIDALRTPFGSFGGSLSDVPAPRLAATVIEKLLERNSLNGDHIDEVILGNVIGAGVGQAPARQAMRNAGLPDGIPALTINKVCGSGLKSIMLGAGSIMLGDSGIVLAGGMENMSMAPYALPNARSGYRLGNGEMTDLLIHDALLDPYSGKHMGMITEACIKENGLGREDQDEFAITSYKRAQTAMEEGRLGEEIVAVTKKSRKGDIVVSEDEEPTKVKFDRIPTLRPVFAKDGTITAANASTINDGAAVVILAGEEQVEKYDLKPIAKIVSYSTHSKHPEQFPEAPVGSIEKACANAKLSSDEVGLYEVNEAFSAVPMIAMKEFKIPSEKMNVNGGAVSIGHPVGASGGRLATTLIKEMHRRNEQYGLASLCIGGGEAVAVIFEKV